jgi:hypothetical protein
VFTVQETLSIGIGLGLGLAIGIGIGYVSLSPGEPKVHARLLLK